MRDHATYPSTFWTYLYIFRPVSDVTPPELKCPDDVVAEALLDRHYALINASTTLVSTGEAEGRG